MFDTSRMGVKQANSHRYASRALKGKPIMDTESMIRKLEIIRQIDEGAITLLGVRQEIVDLIAAREANLAVDPNPERR